MVNYKDYNNSRIAMVNMINDKKDLVNELEDEIHHLRKSLRILDTDFKEKIDNQDLPDDFN